MKNALAAGRKRRLPSLQIPVNINRNPAVRRWKIRRVVPIDDLHAEAKVTIRLRHGDHLERIRMPAGFGGIPAVAKRPAEIGDDHGAARGTRRFQEKWRKRALPVQ